MSGESLLTQGLEPLASKSKAIRSKLNELYAMDNALQAAHEQAKHNGDLGEEVVTKYKAFLSCRQQLIAALEKQKIQVPWQLRMTIDDLELTLMQRREKKKERKSSLSKHNDLSCKETQEPVQSEQSARVAVAFVGPTLVALLIAMLWYHYNA
ncbi:unnamed protein product [Peronospora destructor]|uniref:Uncharacterized protein n=1 Tax=Peronospora destructor TaxID=86335 RepID=A0AAV0UFY5_9STRA|nr:unnamed protein product [Peronospora destructor]